MQTKGEKKVQALKTKAINDKSNNNPPISKDIYDKMSEERIDKILEMSKQINYYNFVYEFKGPTKQ